MMHWVGSATTLCTVANKTAGLSGIFEPIRNDFLAATYQLREADRPAYFVSDCPSEARLLIKGDSMKIEVLAAALALRSPCNPLWRGTCPVLPTHTARASIARRERPEIRTVNIAIILPGAARGGGWDASPDNACEMNPRYVPPQCGGRF
jgi:hypothetical protein